MPRHQNGKVAPDRQARDMADLARLPKSIIDSARVEEDRRLHDRYVADRRQSDRAAVDAPATLWASSSVTVEGHLYSLSAQGCSLRLPASSFEVGDAVCFRIEALDPLNGTIRWVDGEKVGMEFDQPFYYALFELLVHSNRPVTVARAA